MADNTLFDDVFRTLLEKCTKLIIPVLNEVFGTDYRMDEAIRLGANEHFSAQQSEGKIEKQITDSCIFIRNHIYHIECQSTQDTQMVIRMVEYDFHIALSDIERKGEMEVLRFPESAVLYLRHNHKTPDSLKVKLILPNQKEVIYEVPLVKVQKYSKEEIFDKNLLFFLPYYILKFEKELDEIDKDEEKLKDLRETYESIYDELQCLKDEEKIDGMYLYHLVTLTMKLSKYVTRKTEHAGREVAVMGGHVLELEGEKILQRGLERGLEQGLERGKIDTLERYILKRDVDFDEAFEELSDVLDLSEEDYLVYRDKIEERGNVPVMSSPGRSR